MVLGIVDVVDVVLVVADMTVELEAVDCAAVVRVVSGIAHVLAVIKKLAIWLSTATVATLAPASNTLI